MNIHSITFIIDIRLFEKIRKMRVKFKRLTEKFAQSYQNVDPETVEAEIQEAIHAVRKKEKAK